MNWTIRWTSEGWKDLQRLDPQVSERILAALDRLALEEAGDIKRLKGIEPPEWRLRVGKWRVRFRFDHGSGTILVLHVRRRDEAY